MSSCPCRGEIMEALGSILHNCLVGWGPSPKYYCSCVLGAWSVGVSDWENLRLERDSASFERNKLYSLSLSRLEFGRPSTGVVQPQPRIHAVCFSLLLLGKSCLVALSAAERATSERFRDSVFGNLPCYACDLAAFSRLGMRATRCLTCAPGSPRPPGNEKTIKPALRAL